MMVFDYIIANNDRHQGNVGYIRNPDTLEIIGLAPIFDNDQCMEMKDGKPFVDESKFLHMPHEKALERVTDYSWIDVNKLQKIPDIYKEVMKNFKTAEEIDSLCESTQQRIDKVHEKIIEQNKAQNYEETER